MTVPVVALAEPQSGSAPVQGQDFDDHLQQPQIIVRPAPSGQVEEYRMGGKLYMIKVTPEKGSSYYLVDSDGDGSLETRRSELESDFAIPQWTLKRWR
jgi:hypothetical protein